MSDQHEKKYELLTDEVESTAGSRSQKAAPKAAAARTGTDAKNPVDRLLLDRDGSENANYTGDEESERDYRPIRQSHNIARAALAA